MKIPRELQLELLLRLIGGWKEMGNFRKALRLSTLIPLLMDTLEQYYVARDDMRLFKENLYKAAAGQQDYVIVAGSPEAERLSNVVRRVDDLFNAVERRMKR